jgi:hypothetical protein
MPGYGKTLMGTKNQESRIRNRGYQIEMKNLLKGKISGRLGGNNRV